MRPTVMRLLLGSILALGLLTGCGTGAPGHPAGAAPGTPTGATNPPSATWHAETFHDVTLRVPADWIPGFSPITSNGETMWCGGPSQHPYVGRPDFGSDACQAQVLEAIQRSGFDQETVWFDSPLPVGRTTTGIASQTVSIGSQRITVAATDPSVRATILASAEKVTGVDPNGCAASPAAPDQGRPTEGNGAVHAFSVCVYGRDGRLFWSGTRPASAGDDLMTAVNAAPTVRPTPVAQGADLGTVRLVLRAADPFGATDLPLTLAVGFRPEVLTWAGRSLALTKALVEPWAGPATKAYVVGGSNPALAPYFRGILG